MRSIDSIETYACGTSTDLEVKKKRMNLQYYETIQKSLTLMMLQKENNLKEHNPNWPQILDHPYRILIIGGSGFGKINSLFNLISQQLDTDKIHLHAKNPHEEKY